MHQVIKHQLMLLQPQLLLLQQLLQQLLQLLPQPQDKSIMHKQVLLLFNIKDILWLEVHTHMHNNNNHKLFINKHQHKLQLLQQPLQQPKTCLLKFHLILELLLFSWPLLSSYSFLLLLLESSANNSVDNNNTWLLKTKTMAPTKCQHQETSIECDLEGNFF